MEYQGVAAFNRSFTLLMFSTPSDSSHRGTRRRPLRIDRDAVLPGGPAAQHAREAHAGFRGERQRFGELRVADARRKINERLGSGRPRLPETLLGFVACVGFLSAIRLRALDELHVDRHFDLQDVDAIAILLNSSMLAATISGFFFANSRPFRRYLLRSPRTPGRTACHWPGIRRRSAPPTRASCR